MKDIDLRGILNQPQEHEEDIQHFAVGGNLDRSPPLGKASVLGVSEAESALQIARKEAEEFEKRFDALLKKNRTLLFAS